MLLLGEKDATALCGTKLTQVEKTWVVAEEFDRQYYVLSDTLSDRDIDVLAAGLTPTLGDSLDASVCIDHSAKEITTLYHPITHVKAILFEVTCKFSSIFRPGTSITDPTLSPAFYKWTSESEEEQLRYDAITGVPVQTINAEPILVSVPMTRPILEVTRYEYFPFDPSTILTYVNHVNSGTFKGAAAKCALMLAIDVDEETVENVRYNKVCYRIKFRISGDGLGWVIGLLHQGYLVATTAIAFSVPFGNIGIHQHVDQSGNPSICNLLSTGLINTSVDPADAVYRYYNQFPTANFDSLSL